MSSTGVGRPQNDLREVVDRAIEAQDWSTARAGLARLWSEQPGPSQAGFVIGRFARLPPIAARSSIAILRSFTVEPLVPVLRAAAAVSSLDLDVTVGDFNTYAQDLLDEGSPLYTSWNPDVVILAVQTRDIAPDLWVGIADGPPDRHRLAVNRVAGTFQSLIRSFRARSRADLVVHGLELPSEPALGLADRGRADGQVGAVRHLDDRIAELCDEHAGVHYLDYDAVVADCGRTAFFDEAKWSSMRLPIRAPFLARVAHEWLRFILPLRGRSAKVLAVDLDNTVWGGVVGEDGIDGIVVGPDGRGRHFLAVQQALLDLRSRGVLLAACSKNNADEAIDALDRHPEMLLRSHHFSALRINWTDKATNLREIARELNVGIDSVAFLDDNPVERAAVARALPEVTVLEIGDDPATYAGVLRASAVFERLSLSDEDADRVRYYERDRARVELESSADSLEDFLRSLETVVVVGAADPADLPRIAQLTQKTNQFNVTTRRYNEADIAGMSADDDWTVYALRAADRFGDHGLVGVALVERERERRAWRIDTLLLSCRVIGRGVESALLQVVTDDAVDAGADEVCGEFVPTAKNAPAADFYERHGFTRRPDQTDDRWWVRDLAGGAVVAPDWVTIERSDGHDDRSHGG